MDDFLPITFFLIILIRNRNLPGHKYTLNLELLLSKILFQQMVLDSILPKEAVMNLFSKHL